MASMCASRCTARRSPRSVPMCPVMRLTAPAGESPDANSSERCSSAVRMASPFVTASTLPAPRRSVFLRLLQMCAPQVRSTSEPSSSSCPTEDEAGGAPLCQQTALGRDGITGLRGHFGVVMRKESGAGSETRTRTLLPVLDFESSASTSSAIPATAGGAAHEASARDEPRSIGQNPRDRRLGHQDLP